MQAKYLSRVEGLICLTCERHALLSTHCIEICQGSDSFLPGPAAGRWLAPRPVLCEAVAARLCTLAGRLCKILSICPLLIQRLWLRCDRRCSKT